MVVVVVVLGGLLCGSRRVTTFPIYGAFVRPLPLAFPCVTPSLDTCRVRFPAVFKRFQTDTDSKTLINPRDKSPGKLAVASSLAPAGRPHGARQGTLLRSSGR